LLLSGSNPETITREECIKLPSGLQVKSLAIKVATATLIALAITPYSTGEAEVESPQLAIPNEQAPLNSLFQSA
jgi:hypothetical protein